MIICMISTKHSAEMVEVRKRIVCHKPMVVVDYNRGKCAVDLSDQMIAHSTVHRRNLKWYIKLALELLLNTSTYTSAKRLKYIIETCTRY